MIYQLIEFNKALKMIYEESLNLPVKPLEAETFMRKEILEVYKR